LTQNVVVGYLHPSHITQEFHHCLFGAFIHDAWGPQHILNFAPQFSGGNLCKSRNQMVHDMLKQDRAEWLWIVDSDATFPPNILDALLDSADPLERPVVGALAHQYRGKVDEDYKPVFGPTGMQIRELLPTMYQTEWGPDGEWVGYREIESYQLGLQEVDATGCHCVLVHRTVFEAIKSEHPYRWFREDEIAPGTIAGEDIWFCLEAKRAGFPIYVNTALESGHVKPVVLTSEMSHVERIS
jgi:GT2 family glycosyltransferase